VCLIVLAFKDNCCVFSDRWMAELTKGQELGANSPAAAVPKQRQTRSICSEYMRVERVPNQGTGGPFDAALLRMTRSAPTLDRDASRTPTPTPELRTIRGSPFLHLAPCPNLCFHPFLHYCPQSDHGPSSVSNRAETTRWTWIRIQEAAPLSVTTPCRDCQMPRAE
jgi:hypothetical protein